MVETRQGQTEAWGHTQPVKLSNAAYTMEQIIVMANDKTSCIYLISLSVSRVISI